MRRLLLGNPLRRMLLIASLAMMNVMHAAEMAIGSPAGEALDLRILIDISGDVRGSMPEGQHLDAVAMLLAQLPAGSKAGVWTFGKYSNHLVTYGRVDDQWLALANTQLPAIRSVASWRNIARVVTDATFDAARPAVGYRRELLLISGGGINISDDAEVNNQAQQAMLAQQVGPLREAGFRIHTLALGGGAGRDFLGALAREGDGLFFGISRPEQVHAALARFTDFIGPRNLAPLVDGEFAIDTGVERFSALLVSDPGNLVLESPSGKRITADGVPGGVIWQAGALHVRVDVEAPEMGLWRVAGDFGAGSRIYVESDRVISLEPLRSHYVSGEKFAVVSQTPTPGDSPPAYQPPVEVTLEAVGFEGTETFTQQLQADPNQPGQYAIEVPGLVAPDNYQLLVTVQALEYSRAIRHTLQVHELLSLEVQQRMLAEGNVYTLKVVAMDDQLDLAQTRLLVKVTDSSGESSSQVLLPAEDAWHLDVPDDGISETYRLDLHLSGETISGRPVSYQPRPLIITLPERPLATAIDPVGPAVAVTSDDEPRTEAHAGRESSAVAEAPESLPVAPEKEARDKTAVAGERSWLLVVLAAGCVVIAGGLLAFYVWSRRRQPERVDLARDAAAYRAANKISIQRVEAGQTFPDDARTVAAAADTQRDERVSEASRDAASQVTEVVARDAPGGVPLLEDVVPEDILAPNALAVAASAEDILPEDSIIDDQAEVAGAPGKREPETVLDAAGEGQGTEPGGAGEGEQLAVAGDEAVPGEQGAALAGAAGGSPAFEDVEATSATEPELVSATIATARPDTPAVSITRIPELAGAPVAKPQPPAAVVAPGIDEELPDFETVDAALAEEIAADTALAEETELAPEWRNVSLLNPRAQRDEDRDLVARELDGDDPFADYRAEYEASRRKEGG